MDLAGEVGLADSELQNKVGTSNLQAIIARLREDGELREYLRR